MDDGDAETRRTNVNMVEWRGYLHGWRRHVRSGAEAFMVKKISSQ